MHVKILNFVGNISPIDCQIRKNDGTVHFDGCIVGVENGLRFYLSNNDSEVISLAGSVIAYWSERNCLSVICVVNKGRIACLLQLHFADVNVSGTVVLRILNLR